MGGLPAHVARNVAAIAESSERVNQPIGARLVLLADAVFRTRHRWECGELSKEKYLRRLARYRQSWRTQLERGALLGTVADVSCCCGMTRCCGGL